MVRRLHCALPAQLTAAITGAAAIAQQKAASCLGSCSAADGGNLPATCFNTSECSFAGLAALPAVFACDWEAATLRRPPLLSVFESLDATRPYAGGLPPPGAQVPAPWNTTVRLPAAFEMGAVYAQYRSKLPALQTSLPAVPGVPGEPATPLIPDAVFPNASTHCVQCPDCVAPVVTCVAPNAGAVAGRRGWVGGVGGARG
jgi:hypothetical protein